MSTENENHCGINANTETENPIDDHQSEETLLLDSTQGNIPSAINLSPENANPFGNNPNTETENPMDGNQSEETLPLHSTQGNISALDSRIAGKDIAARREIYSKSVGAPSTESGNPIDAIKSEETMSVDSQDNPVNDNQSEESVCVDRGIVVKVKAGRCEIDNLSDETLSSGNKDKGYIVESKDHQGDATWEEASPTTNVRFFMKNKKKTFSYNSLVRFPQ